MTEEQSETDRGILRLQSIVMTEEQLETLRRQISVYSAICRQLVEMHKASLAQPPPPQFPGGILPSHLPYDPVTGMHKATSRQRWSPTQVQLQILERIFEQGRVTPNKQRIKEITNELSRHGPIAETNVYNWFQNRKARAKRKQASQTNNTNSNNNASSRDGDSEADTDGGESPPVEKRSRLYENQQQQQRMYSNPALDQENRVPHPIRFGEKPLKFGDRAPRERSLNSMFSDDQNKVKERTWNVSAGVLDVCHSKPQQQNLQRTSSGGVLGINNNNPCLAYGVRNG